jgi:hypothetical protein
MHLREETGFLRNEATAQQNKTGVDAYYTHDEVFAETTERSDSLIGIMGFIKTYWEEIRRRTYQHQTHLLHYTIQIQGNSKG